MESLLSTSAASARYNLSGSRMISYSVSSSHPRIMRYPSFSSQAGRSKMQVVSRRLAAAHIIRARASAGEQEDHLICSSDNSAKMSGRSIALLLAPVACVASVLMGAEAAEAAVQGAAVAALAAESAASLSVQDACSQELGGADLNTLIVAACVVEFIALTGAAVGGYIARVRKQEVEKINAQLRQININLRKQARVESYAPALSYAPVGSPAVKAAAAATIPSQAQTATSPGTAASATRTASGKEEVLGLLRAGKQQLRDSNPAGAAERFQRALDVAQRIGDVVEEKKAARGVGASLQRQGKYQDAIKFHNMVLQRSSSCGEHSGDTEAYGAIADCYTELGDLENAAKFYDQYILRLEDEE